MRLLAFAICVLVAVPVTAQSPGHSQGIPALQFPTISTFLDAIDIETEIAAVVDSVWKPAIEQIVAANPKKSEVARRFAEAHRVRELPSYRPLVAFQLDQAASRMLDPALDAQIKAVMADHRQRSRAAGANRAAQDVLLKTASTRIAALKAASFAPTNAKLTLVTRLARTPDGVALRALNRKQLYACLPSFPPPQDARMSEQRRAYCAPLLASPVLARLRAQPLGPALINLSGGATAIVLGTVAMSHDAGTGPRQLISERDYAAAGLAIPTPPAPPERPL